MALCLAALTLVLSAHSVHAAELSDTILRIKPSIVGVGTFQEIRRPRVRFSGTGFAIADGFHILTNQHVIDIELDEKRREYLCILVGTGRSPTVLRARVKAVDEAHDVAVLIFEGGDKLPPMDLGDSDAVREGQEIAFTGFPIGAVLGLYPVTHRGIVSARTPIAIPQRSPRALDTNMIRLLRAPFEVLQLDATAYPGNSGSPLYDPGTGKVLGIISSVFVKSTKENVLKDPSGITYAVPIGYAKDVLRQNGIAGE
jgi:S1-C subfamily serine protease